MIKSFMAAMAFLTVAPIPARLSANVRDLSSSTAYFPVIGILIGVVMAALDYVLGLFLPVWPRGALTVAAMALVSGGLHVDGLADAADGLLSGAPGERALDIMKDSRSGPMGVMAVVLVMAVKITSLASVADDARWAALLLAPLAGLCAMALLIGVFPYVRPGGLGAVFQDGKKPVIAVWAMIFLGAVCIAAAGGMGALVFVMVLMSSLAFALFSRRRIGGMTGDTYGAACEIAEAAALIAAAAWSHGAA